MNKKTMTAVILTAALLFAIPAVLGEYAKSSDADSVTEVSNYEGLLNAIGGGGECCRDTTESRSHRGSAY